MAKPDMREVALDTLLDIERNHTLSHVAIGNTLLTLQFSAKQDRAFYTRLCEGVMEQRIYLEYCLDQVSKTPMKKCKPLIRCLLLMSAYQILCMNVPDSAACNEAVRLAKKRGFGRLSGFVNGVLRNLSRKKDTLEIPGKEESLSLHYSIRYSMAEWIVDLLLSQYGDEITEKILSFFLEVRPVSIRTNQSKTTPQQLEKLLVEEGVTVCPGHYLDYAFSISDYDYLNKLKTFRQGYFAVQDESSVLAVEIAGIKPGDVVLDLCAAPGGKSCHAADLTGENGRVYARDLTEYKTELIEENIERFGFHNVKVSQHDAARMDESMIARADVVIADLPCSGLGIMGRKNDIKNNVTPKQLEDLVKIQREILSIAWRYLKPGGTLLFSTCTLNKKENEDNAAWIRENTPLIPVSIEDRLPAALQGRTGEDGYLQLIPGVDACDGFFVSKFCLPAQ